MHSRFPIILAAVALLIVLGAGCGGSKTSPSRPAAASAAGSSGSHQAESPVPSEAQSAATGDIPDNQVFLTYKSAAGYAIRYPEGWARIGSGSNVTFQNNANLIHVQVVHGPPRPPTAVSAEVTQLKRGDPTIGVGSPRVTRIGGAAVVKVTYRRLSAPNPVTGKRLPLTIDRYEYARAGKLAVLDLGTPVGVDNVDAYKMISRTFRWR